jgi:hypothetical protein
MAASTPLPADQAFPGSYIDTTTGEAVIVGAGANYPAQIQVYIEDNVTHAVSPTLTLTQPFPKPVALATPGTSSAYALSSSAISFATSSVPNAIGYALEVALTANGQYVEVYRGTSSNYTLNNLPASSPRYGRWKAIGVGANKDSGYSAVASATTQAAASTAPRVLNAEIPFNPEWMFVDDVSSQNVTPFFDGVLNEDVQLNGGGGPTQQGSVIVCRFPKEMAVELINVKFGDGQHDNVNTPIMCWTLDPVTLQRVYQFSFTGTGGNGILEDNFLSSTTRTNAFLFQWGYPLPTEIKFIGNYTPYTPPAYVPQAPLMEEMFGNVTYIYDQNLPSFQGPDQTRLELSECGHFYRLYMDTGLIYNPATGLCTFQPTGNGAWSFDDVIYEMTVVRGMRLMLCPKGFEGATWYPMVCQQIAIRYGKNKNVDPSKLKIFTGPGYPANEIKIGLGYNVVMQLGNEQWRWWKGDADIANQQNLEGNMTVYETFQQHKACYDLIKADNPDMKVVTGGMPSNQPGILKGLLWYCHLYNNDVTVFDGVAYHDYLNVNGGQNLGGQPVGVQPELNNAFAEHALAFGRAGQQWCPDKTLEVFVTESGYSHANQPGNNKEQTAPPTATKDTFRVHADWMVRMALEGARAGLSGIAAYQLFDDSNYLNNLEGFVNWDTSNGMCFQDKYGNVGLLPASDAHKQSMNLLRGYRLASYDLSDPTMRVQRYTKVGAPDIYSLHLVSHSDATKNYTLAVPAGATPVRKDINFGTMAKVFSYVRPAPPTLTSNDGQKTIAASCPFGDSEIVYMENGNYDFKQYTGPITVPAEGRPAGWYQFRVKEKGTRNVGIFANSPAFTANAGVTSTVVTQPTVADTNVMIDKYTPNTQTLDSQNLTVSNGSATVTVGETPCYVVMTGTTGTAPTTSTNYGFTEADPSAGRVNESTMQDMQVSDTNTFKSVLATDLTNKRIILADGVYAMDYFEQLGTWTNVLVTSANKNTLFLSSNASTCVLLQGGATRTNIAFRNIRWGSMNTQSGNPLFWWDELPRINGIEISGCDFTCPNGAYNAMGCVQYSTSANSGNVAENVLIENNNFHDVGRCGIELLSQGYDGVIRLKNLTIRNNTFDNLGLKNEYGMAVSLSGLFQRIAVSGNITTRWRRIAYEFVNTQYAVAKNNNATNGTDGVGYGISDDGKGYTADIVVEGGIIQAPERPFYIYEGSRITIDGKGQDWTGGRHVQMGSVAASNFKNLRLLIQNTLGADNPQPSWEWGSGTINCTATDCVVSSAGSIAAGRTPAFETLVIRNGATGNTLTNITTILGRKADGSVYAPLDNGGQGNIVNQGGDTNKIINNVFSVEAVSTSNSATFTTTQSGNTSAGVFSGDTLIRTLYNNQPTTAGTQTLTWDGKDDMGAAKAPGTYAIRRSDPFQIQYDWQGARIGNTSTAISGNTRHKAFQGVRGMAISGGTAYYCTNYDEGWSTAFKFSLNNIQSRTHITQTGQTNQGAQFVATDGVLVYWAGPDCNAQTNTFIYATRCSDDSEVTDFPAGAPVATVYGRTYPSAIARLNTPEAAITGLAVQKNGNLLLVARAALNNIYVHNKTTGELITTIGGYSNPRCMTFDYVGGVWLNSYGNALTHHTIDANGSFSGPTLSLSGLVTPLDLDVSPDGAIVAICDGNNGSEVIRAYNTNDGSVAWTFGNGSYTTDPTVANDKFFFVDRNTVPSDTFWPFICFAPDGSFWVGDGGNCRMQHYAADRTFIDRIMYLPHSYGIVVDKNNPRKLINGLMEFDIDYSKELDQPGAWTLVRNYRGAVPDAFHREGNSSLIVRSLVTLSNRTYGLMVNTTTYKPTVIEFPVNAPLRVTPTEFAVFANVHIRKDGTLRRYVNGGVGNTAAVYSSPFSAVDASGNLNWGTETTIAGPILVTIKDPQNQSGVTEGQSTTSGKVIFFNSGGEHPGGDGDGSGFHLGAIATGATSWAWRTSLATGRTYTGDFPTDGRFDTGNGVDASGAGGDVVVLDNDIFWNYHGESWKGSQTNYWNHFADNGLMIGQFGDYKRSYGDESIPKVAGNVAGGSVVNVGGVLYLYHNDEGINGGVHRWKITGASTVSYQTATVVLAANS